MRSAADRGLPPLWLAAAALAAAWGALYSVVRWTFFYLTSPVHEDVRIWYVASEAGIRRGWSSIYDLDTLRALSSVFPAAERHIDSAATYVNPPLLAWIFVPLTWLPEAVAYGVWSAVLLGALAWAWYLAAPYHGLGKATMLLLALALWPVLLSFYFGQPSLLIVALVAASWWSCSHDRPWAAGVALALATFLKPQVVVLLPAALLVAGRYGPVLAWAAACTVLGALSAVAIGTSGALSWWLALQSVQSDSTHAYFTLAQPFGFGPLTYALWALQGAAALAVAWRRRRETEVVFAAGIAGSLAVAFHLHQADYSQLILAAWLVLRTTPPVWHRAWLGLGIVTMQLVTFGLPGPQLLWDAGWLGILLFSNFAGSGESAPATRRAAASAAHAGR